MPLGRTHEGPECVCGPLDEEVRECLDNVSSTDSAIAEDAVYGLFELLVGGRVVGRITLPAVPYVADFVEAEVGDIAALLMLLGSIADTNDEVGIPDGSARGTVANELPRLVRFLEHQDPEVRRQAVYAVAQCRRPETTFSTLLARWEIERESEVEADLLFALAVLDPQQTAPLIAAVQPDEPSTVRMAALFTGIDVGLPWATESSESMLALLQAGEELDGSPWIDRFERPLQGLVERLWTRGHADAAVELLTKAVTTDFGDHHIDLAVAVEEALGLDEDELGLERPNARTSVLRTLLEQARES